MVFLVDAPGAGRSDAQVKVDASLWSATRHTEPRLTVSEQDRRSVNEQVEAEAERTLGNSSFQFFFLRG